MTVDHPVTAMSFDELLAVSAVLGDRRVRLHLDDAPESYGTEDDEACWVLRRELVGSGVSGWLGLRVPFDPSSGVLVHSSRSLFALHGGEQSLPVHGIVRLPPGATHPTEDQEELLLLERLLVYQQLSSMLGSGVLEGSQLQAAYHYAAAFSIDAWRRGRLQRGSARELASLVPCPPFSSLHEWLSLDDPGPPPASVHPTLARLYQAGPIDPEGGVVGRADLQQRFLRAIGWDYDFDVAIDMQYLEDPNERVRLHERGPSDGPILILNLHNSLVTRVVDTGGYSFSGDMGLGSLDRRQQRARDLLLLDMAWRFARWGRKRGHPVDLPAIHRALMAASLDS